MSGALHVTCPKCGKHGDVPEAFVGKDLHCKKCDSHFIVSETGEVHLVEHHHGHGHATGHGHGHGHAPAVPHEPVPAPASAPTAAAPEPQNLMEALATVAAAAPSAPAANLLDCLSDEAGLAPLTDEDEKHARERYEARVLSKDRVAHYDDHGNLLSEAEYEERLKQGRASVH